MNDFKINRNSWHYKLNKKFLNEDGFSDSAMRLYWEPKVNNFCAYWRATMIRITLILVMIAVVLFLVGGLAFLTYTDPIGALSGFAVLFGMFVLAGIVVASVNYVPEYFKKASDSIENSDSLVVTKYKSFKSKICPGVKYND